MKLQEKIESGMPVILINESQEDIFEASSKLLIDSGYIVSSTSCGFIDSAEYEYCSTLRAVFIITSGEG